MNIHNLINYFFDKKVNLILYLILTVFIIGVINNAILSIALFIILVFVQFILIKEKAFLIFSFLVPFYGILVIPFVNRSLLPLLVSIIIARNYDKLIANLQKSNELNNYLLLFLISLMINLLLFSNNYLNDLVYKYDIILLLFLLVIFRIILIDYSYLIEKILLYFIIGAAVSVIYGLLTFNFRIEAPELGSYLRLKGALQDVNYLGRLLLFGISFGFIILKTSGNSDYKKIVLFTLPILIFGILFTISLMSILILSLILASFFLLNEKKYFKYSFLVITLFLVFNFFISSNHSILSSVLLRLELLQSGIKAFSRGRLDYHQFVLDYWYNSKWENILLGFGYGNVPQIIQAHFGIKDVMHSLYFQTLVELGILGFLPFLMLIFTMIKINFNNSSKLVLAVFLLTGFFISGILYWDQFIVLAIINQKILK